MLMKQKIEFKNFTKMWVIVLLKIFTVHGKKLKYKNYIKKVLFNFIKNSFDINTLFLNFHKILFFPFFFFIRVVAGRKILIPWILKKEKEIFYNARLIKNVISSRPERFFYDKLYNELKDIYLEKASSFAIKKINNLFEDLKSNFVNTRFTRVFKKYLFRWN